MTLLLLGKKVLNMPRSSSLISLDFRVVKFIRLISKKYNEEGTNEEANHICTRVACIARKLPSSKALFAATLLCVPRPRRRNDNVSSYESGYSSSTMFAYILGVLRCAKLCYCLLALKNY